MVKGLKKENLINWGISVEKNEDGSYAIYRTGFKSGFCLQRVTRKVKISVVTCKHKYGTDKSYETVAFSVDSKPKALLLSRIVYAWFVSDIPDGYDVDHIDNNTFNNSVENLQLLTRKENLAKRGTGRGVGRNQYSAHMTDKEILAMRELKLNKKNINSKIHEMYNKVYELRQKYKDSLSNQDIKSARMYKKEILKYKEELKSLVDAKKDINKKLK